MAIRLTDKFLEAAKGDPAGRREYLDALVPGLAFIVQPSGVKSWAVRYRDASKKPTKVTLARYPLLGLGEAREQAREVLQKVAIGQDPAAEKRTTKLIVFTEAPSRERDLWWAVVTDYLKRDAAGLRSHDAISAILERETKSAWSGKLIREISKRDVIRLIDGIVDRGAPIAANRALAHIARVFSWAAGRDLIDTNPAKGLQKQPETTRDRILLRSEIRDLWSVAEGMAYPFGPMTQMLILSGQRLREVAEAERSEFDLDGRLWTIPPERAKNGQRHLVPLAPAVITLIKAQPKLGRQYLFTTTTTSPISGFAKAKATIDAELAALDLKRAKEARANAKPEPRPHWQFHDLRRTAASGMAALGVMGEVVERVLNHQGASRRGVALVYNRHDFLEERRVALEKWADEVARIVGPPVSSEPS